MNKAEIYGKIDIIFFKERVYMINACIMATIALYLIGMLAVGFKMSGENKSTGDFYLGGRKLGPLVTAMSAEASDMSSWLLMGLPGVALAGSIAEAFYGFPEELKEIVESKLDSYLLSVLKTFNNFCGNE